MADQQHHHHQHHHIPGMEDVEGKISCEGNSHVEAPSIHLHRLPERSVDIKDTDFLAHGQPPGVFSAELNLDKPKKVKDSTSQAHGALPGVFHWNESNTITETGKISGEGISHVEAPSIHLHPLPERSADIKDTDFLAHGQPPGVFSAELNLDKPKKAKDSTSQAHGALPGVFHWNQTNTITETGTAHEGNLYSYKGKDEAEKETYNEEQADKKGGDHWKVETSIAEGD